MPKRSKKVKMASLSVASNTTLIILKVFAGIASGSVSIISEAIHSGMDLIASMIALYSVSVSHHPADEEHPYGHGKIENISGVVEGLLIFIAAFLIIKEAVLKIQHPTELNETWVAIGVMVFSAVVNSIISAMLYRTARAEDSVALEADALHLKTDVYTSLGVAGGLLLIKMTGITILDPIVAILVALLIIKEAWALSSHAFHPLLDASLSPEEKAKTQTVLERYNAEMIDYHKLRNRKSGSVRYIDFHITVPQDLTVGLAHELSRKITVDLEQVLQNTSIIIHIDPYSES
ncbi:MAG: cation diffusion facilitator family transporter [Firmicutes bacterium]|nr:cation diffusion facilitator family transporter [Bacillota bacterium]